MSKGGYVIVTECNGFEAIVRAYYAIDHYRLLSGFLRGSHGI